MIAQHSCACQQSGQTLSCRQSPQVPNSFTNSSHTLHLLRMILFTWSIIPLTPYLDHMSSRGPSGRTSRPKCSLHPPKIGRIQPGTIPVPLLRTSNTPVQSRLACYSQQVFTYSVNVHNLLFVLSYPSVNGNLARRNKGRTSRPQGVIGGLAQANFRRLGIPRVDTYQAGTHRTRVWPSRSPARP